MNIDHNYAYLIWLPAYTVYFDFMAWLAVLFLYIFNCNLLYFAANKFFIFLFIFIFMYVFDDVNSVFLLAQQFFRGLCDDAKKKKKLKSIFG